MFLRQSFSIRNLVWCFDKYFQLDLYIFLFFFDFKQRDSTGLFDHIKDILLNAILQIQIYARKLDTIYLFN